MDKSENPTALQWGSSQTAKEKTAVQRNVNALLDALATIATQLNHCVRDTTTFVIAHDPSLYTIIRARHHHTRPLHQQAHRQHPSLSGSDPTQTRHTMERLIMDVDFKSEFQIVQSVGTYKAMLQSLP